VLGSALLSHGAAVRDLGGGAEVEQQPAVEEPRVILDRMAARIAELRQIGDNRRIFLSVYATMTDAITRGIHDGRFMDAAWTAELTTRFAGLYFDADEAWDHHPDRCSNAWRAAFAATERPRISAIEQALLGINAHIVFDLPFAVSVTMCSVGDVVDGRLQGDTLVRRRHDYEVVNHILAETILDAQAVLAAESRVSRVLDRVTLRFDEYAAEALLRASRTQGWHQALALAVARDESEREAVRQHLDRVACGYVQRLDVTQCLPGKRVRRAVARFRPPFTTALEEPSAVPGVATDGVASRRNRRRDPTG
jgi:hypothetical protein